jgi:Ca2+-binding RTX toxin-like protein
MRWSRRATLAAAIAVAAAVIVVPTAHAASICTFDASTRTLSIHNQDPLTFISASSGDLIVTSTNCGAISTMDKVIVDTSNSPNLRFTLTEPLGPGYTDEGDASSELEFEIVNHYGSDGSIDVVGGEGPDGITVGYDVQTFVNLNALTDGGSPDADVKMLGKPLVFLWGNGGNDVLSGDGIGGGGPGTFPSRMILYDGAGADTVTGSSTSDLIYFQDAVADGADTFVGGGGPDQAHAQHGNAAVSASITLDDLANDGAGCPGVACDGDNVASDIERLYGSKTNELLVGTAGRQLLDGGGGDDVLFGQGGQDDLWGVHGSDELNGGDGKDSLDGGKGADTVSGGGAQDTMTWRDAYTSLTVDEDGVADDGRQGEHDNILPDVEVLYGTYVADVLIGGDAPNIFWGSNGDDILRGLGGNDWLDGQEGNDTLDGGPGTDVCHQGTGSGTKIDCES